MSADSIRDKANRQKTGAQGAQGAQPSPFSAAGLRVPPQNVDAEMAVLGSIMLRPDSLNDVMDILRPETFYADKHRIIYEAMLELFNTSNPIDLLTVSDNLKNAGTFDRIGGAAYISQLVQNVPSAANVLYYANMVQKKYMMRRLIEAADHVSNLGYDESYELEAMLDEAQKKIFDVTNASMSSDFVVLSNSLDEAIERMNKLHEQGQGLRGVPTGFRKLDNLLSGLQKSDLIILAARPSVGKTSFALDMARHAAVKEKVPTLVFSLEMSAGQLVDRLIAAQSGVDAWKMRTGGLHKEEDFRRVSEAADELSHAPVFIDDQAGNTILKMRSVARRIKHEHGLGLIVVDYLQLMSPSNTKNSDNLVQQITEISRSLKQLAREMDVPVLALSQLSRAVEQRGGEPRLSDLRDSGSIEQDADVVMFIHREMTDTDTGSKKRSNVAKILVQKHRNGPVGDIELVFNENTTKFVENAGGGFDDFAASAPSSDPSADFF